MEVNIVKNRIMARGYSSEYEKEYIKKDGTVFPAAVRVWLIKDEQGNPIGMLTVVRSLTERRRAEEAPQEGEAYTIPQFPHQPLGSKLR